MSIRKYVGRSVAIMLLMLPTSVVAQPSTAIPDAARDIFGTVMSPFCPTLLLANCQSPQADSLRRAVVVRANAGESRTHIVDDLRRTYGDVILAEPERRGFGLVAWLVPGVAVGVGLLWLLSWTSKSVQPPPHATHYSAHDGSNTEMARIDALMRSEGAGRGFDEQ
jgi:cytochrome c-type biogenesis protein CcmH